MASKQSYGPVPGIDHSPGEQPTVSHHRNHHHHHRRSDHRSPRSSSAEPFASVPAASEIEMDGISPVDDDDDRNGRSRGGRGGGGGGGGDEPRKKRPALRVTESRNRSLVAPKSRQKGQFWKILARLMARLVIDAALWASFIAAVMYTERVGSLTRSEKHLFNAFGIALPLMLGLNYNSSFQAMAGIMRWKVLSSGQFTFKEVRVPSTPPPVPC